jgi:mRNA-degrading endonuclease RelE of RelBE toxin-antitoxin system
VRVLEEGWSMNVTVAEPAQIILRNMSEDDRRKVGAWIDYLKRWDTDPFAKQHSKKLDTSDNVYMLLTSTDIRIFFALEEDTITVLDLARKATIISSGQISGGGRP